MDMGAIHYRLVTLVVFARGEGGVWKPLFAWAVE
jgi:hypothetical protein